MATKTAVLSCIVSVQYLQQPLKSYHQHSKSIVSSRQFQDASKDVSQSQSKAISDSSSSEQSQSSSSQQASQTEASVSGSGWGVSLEASASHSQSSSNSSASASASSLSASRQMANAFRMASSAASETEQMSHNESTETIEFHDGFLQIIQEVKTEVSINGISASVVEEKLMNAVPIDKPKTWQELQEMAERYIATFDDGTGLGIIIGPMCIATKVTKIVSYDPKSLEPTATEQIRAQIKALENQLQNQPSAAEHALINKRAKTWLLAQKTTGGYIPIGDITSFDQVLTGSTNWPNTGSGTSSFTVPTPGTYEVWFSARKSKYSGVYLNVNGTKKRDAYLNDDGGDAGTLTALWSILLAGNDKLTLESAWAANSIYCAEQSVLIVKINLVL